MLKKISNQTAGRALKEFHFMVIEKKKKPVFPKINIKACLRFAKKKKKNTIWTIKQWKKMIWSEKSKLNRFSSDRRSWC